MSVDIQQLMTSADNRITQVTQANDQYQDAWAQLYYLWLNDLQTAIYSGDTSKVNAVYAQMQPYIDTLSGEPKDNELMKSYLKNLTTDQTLITTFMSQGRTGEALDTMMDGYRTLGQIAIHWQFN